MQTGKRRNATWRIMIFFRIGNVSIFRAMKAQTQIVSAAFFAIARCTHLAIAAGEILPIRTTALRTAQPACARTDASVIPTFASK